MELLASELKGRGAYLSRTLSYAGSTFETVRSELTADMGRQWDEASAFWVDMLRVFERALYLANLPIMKARFLLAFYWGAHQRFFKQLCVCFKVRSFCFAFAFTFAAAASLPRPVELDTSAPCSSEPRSARSSTSAARRWRRGSAR
jgi:hypothetical protein